MNNLILQRNRFNTEILKIIAVITMVIDHIGAIFLPQYAILRYIGRMAFPMFTYAVAVGYRYTHNKKKYFRNLFIFGIITIPFYVFAFGKVRTNTMLEFAALILFLYFLDNTNKLYKPLATFLIIVLCTITEIFILPLIGFSHEYGLYGILMGIIFYYFDVKHYHPIITLMLFSFITICYGNRIQMIAPVAYIIIICINMFDFSKIKLNKWFFYIFYPGHLALFGLIKLIIQ